AIGQPLQEEEAEDEVLVVGGVDRAPEDVGRGPQIPLQALAGELLADRQLDLVRCWCPASSRPALRRLVPRCHAPPHGRGAASSPHDAAGGYVVRGLGIKPDDRVPQRAGVSPLPPVGARMGPPSGPHREEDPPPEEEIRARGGGRRSAYRSLSSPVSTLRMTY